MCTNRCLLEKLYFETNIAYDSFGIRVDQHLNTLCLSDTGIVPSFMLILFSGVQDKTQEIANLNQQLGLLGLKVVPVTADGNCFFRYIYMFSY